MATTGSGLATPESGTSDPWRSAAFVAGDEVYGGRELRRGIRQRGMGYVMAVRSNHAITVGSSRTLAYSAASAPS